MHLGTISFCDRVALNIKSNETKEVILQELETRFRLKVIQKHSVRLDRTNINTIRQHTHFGCLRSNGNPYYMVFTRHEDVPVIYYIDKKILPGYHHPRIILGRGRFAEDLYDNTILDGEMVRKTDGSGWAFLINDIYAYKNQLLEAYDLPYRLAFVSNILQNDYAPDRVWDKCEFRMKEWYPIGPDTVARLLELNTQLPYTNRGIYFWPTSVRHKPKLFNFDESLIQEVKPKIKETAIFRTGEEEVALSSAVAAPVPGPAPVPATPASSLPLDKDARTLLLQKTEFPDVYYVFEPKTREKLGTAFVGSLQQSRMLHDCFKVVNLVTYLPFTCVLNQEKGKWSPVAVAT